MNQGERERLDCSVSSGLEGKNAEAATVVLDVIAVCVTAAQLQMLTRVRVS